jgi:hypothetical protein
LQPLVTTEIPDRMGVSARSADFIVTSVCITPPFGTLSVMGEVSGGRVATFVQGTPWSAATVGATRTETDTLVFGGDITSSESESQLVSAPQPTNVCR